MLDKDQRTNWLSGRPTGDTPKEWVPDRLTQKVRVARREREKLPPICSPQHLVHRYFSLNMESRSSLEGLRKKLRILAVLGLSVNFLWISSYPCLKDHFIKSLAGNKFFFSPNIPSLFKNSSYRIYIFFLKEVLRVIKLYALPSIMPGKEKMINICLIQWRVCDTIHHMPQMGKLENVPLHDWLKDTINLESSVVCEMIKDLWNTPWCQDFSFCNFHDSLWVKILNYSICSF